MVCLHLTETLHCLGVQSVVAKGLLVSIAEKSNYVPVFLNFSAQTSSIRTQEMIEGKLEKKRKNILGRLFLHICQHAMNNCVEAVFLAQLAELFI